jgi:dihydroorotate dehydrogenase electron transfer subunit
MEKTKKGRYWARVCSNKQTGYCFHKIVLEFKDNSAKAFALTQPGQFVEIDLSKTALPADEQIPDELKDKCKREILLRRPFSFCDVSSNGNETVVEILYCIVGPASLRMTTLKTGDKVSVIGPLGNGFNIPKGKKTALLVAGGMGSPPLQHLAKVIAEDYPDIELIVLAGARTKEDMPFEKDSFPKNSRLIVTTDDGTIGKKGLVTEQLEAWLEKCKQKADDIGIYGCGPEEMLARVAQIANERKIDCQISMERRMACGIGVCLGCAVECREEDSKETIYKMCCTDGPVFDAKEIVFSY